MEQNMNATMPAMSSGQQGNGSGLKIATAITSIIAICGIGFGVYGMMQSSNKDGQISDLKVQIANSDGTVTTIETPKVETTTNDGTVVTITDSAAKDVNAEDYIYVGEWGLKIKKPEGLSTVSYRYSHGAGYTEVVAWGVDCSNGQCHYFPEFADVTKNGTGLGRIRRYSKGKEFDGGSAPELVFSDDQYDYYFFHIQVAYSADHPENDELEWEMSSIDLVSGMLNKSDNYSAI